MHRFEMLQLVLRTCSRSHILSLGVRQ